MTRAAVFFREYEPVILARLAIGHPVRDITGSKGAAERGGRNIDACMFGFISHLRLCLALPC